MTWYVRTANREFGPLSEQALARHSRQTGQIDVKTLVRRSVAEEWVSVAAVPGILAPASRVAVPPAPRAEPPLALLPDPPRTVAPRPGLPLRWTLEGLPIPVEIDIATPWRRFWARRSI